MCMKILFVAIVLVFVNTLSRAQVQEQLSPTEKKYQSVVTEPLTIYKGYFRAGLAGWFTFVNKIFTDKGKRVLVDNNGGGTSMALHTSIQYGITDRLQAELLVPYVRQTLTLSSVYEFPGADTAYQVSHRSLINGLDDLDVAMMYQIIPGNFKKPFLGIGVTATLPTGEKNPSKVDPKNPNNFTAPPGSGEFSLLTQVRFRKITFPFSYNMFLGCKVNFGGAKLIRQTDTKETPFKSGNRLNMGGSFNLHLNNWIIFKNFTELNFLGPGTIGTEKGSDAWLLTYYPGLSFQIKNFRIDQSIVFPVKGKSILADPVYILSVYSTF